jgi:hypothetical protein
MLNDAAILPRQIRLYRDFVRMVFLGGRGGTPRSAAV